MKTTTIIYRNNPAGYSASLITSGENWRRDAAYYLTMEGYSLESVTQADICETCKGAGRVKNGRRVGPLHSFRDCTACKGAGHVNEQPVDASTITASEYQPYI